MWESLKAQLLEAGTAQLTGADASEYISTSSAGPGAGGNGSVFFSYEGHRVRLSIAASSLVVIRHIGGGTVMLTTGYIEALGKLEKPGCHCPDQAYITISGSCIHSCRYCPVPENNAGTKSSEEILSLVSGAGNISAISLTGGVAENPEAEERTMLQAARALQSFGLPIGVSVYPLPGSARRFFEAGAREIKFNLETATPELFAEMCPGMNWELINAELDAAVPLFGRGHVFTNLIFGLGETDEEMKERIDDVCSRGIIPSLRPLTPAAACSGYARPGFKRFMTLYRYHRSALARNGLDPSLAETMCIRCTGCDLVPVLDAE
jgi:biotin synthase-related radical SAM superfamily protein